LNISEVRLSFRRCSTWAISAVLGSGRFGTAVTMPGVTGGGSDALCESGAMEI
jgi:hypothetical protein